MLHRQPGFSLTRLANLLKKGLTLSADSSPTLSAPLNTNGNMIQGSKGADVASASALNLGTDGNFFDITGTTTITSISAETQAPFVILQFDGSLTLTHHATNLILPGRQNIVTQAGDIAQFVQYASGQWVCVNYQRASGAGAAGWQLADATTLSAQASYGIGSTDAGIGLENFREVQFRFFNILPASANGDWIVRTDSGGADSGDAGASDYTYISGRISAAGTGVNSDASTDIILISETGTDQPATSGMGLYGTFTYMNFNQAVEGLAEFHVAYEDESSEDALISLRGFGGRLAATARDYIQLLNTGGNIASGYIETWVKA